MRRVYVRICIVRASNAFNVYVISTRVMNQREPNGNHHDRASIHDITLSSLMYSHGYLSLYLGIPLCC